ncbi:MAG TPA: LysM domain-containing protein [Candidatus Dormibacteraeota bacterium]|nr:LysM domain-containing protein [Candidatus Dormibacteraeota bacterium]
MFYIPRRSRRVAARPISGRRARPWERERRVITRLAVTAALMGALMTTGVLGSQRSAGSWVTVRAGQSLWSIASQHYPETDPRQAILDIQAKNRLLGQFIYPGERLLLPAE